MTEQFDPYYTWLGIRPEEQPANHYRLLGLIEFEDNAETIQNAADRQMAHLRTFQAGKHAMLSQKLLNEVAAAKLCLLVAAKKAEYDAGLRQQLQPEGTVLEDLAAAIEPLGATHHFAPKSATPWGTIVTSVIAAAVVAAGLVAWLGAPGKKEKGDAAAQPVVGPTRPGTTSVAVAPSPPAAQPSAPPPASQGTRETRPSTPAAPPPAPLPAAQGASQTQPAPNPVAAAGTVAPPPITVSIAPPITPPAVRRNAPVVRAPSATVMMFAAAARAFRDAASPPLNPQPPLKLPVPSTEVQQGLLAQINATFPSAGQTDRGVRIALANQLIAAAKQQNGEPNLRFVLYRRAAEIACSAGEVGPMLQAVESMGREFQIDLLDAEEKMVARMLAGAEISVAFDPALTATWRLADRAVAEKRFEVALAALEEAQGVCGNAQCAALRKDLRVREGEVQKLAKQWQQVEQATVALKQSVDDPQANLALGSWYWFKEEKPELAWPYLAKGSDETLKNLAQQELAPPSDADSKAKLGDAWLSIARLRTGGDRTSMLVRAAFWYQRVLDSAPEALTKLRVEKRLEEIVRMGRPLGKSAAGHAAGNALRLHLLPGGLIPRGVWVDLLEYADLPNGVAKNDQWKWTDDGISGARASGPLPLRVTIEGHYDLEVQFTRFRATDTVLLMFVVNMRQCMLALGAYKTKEYCFSALEGQLDNPLRPIVTSATPGDFANNQRHTALFRVRLLGDNASVEVRFDSKPLLFWAGPQTGVKRRWGLLVAPNRPALATFSPLTFHSVRLRLISGKAQVVPAGRIMLPGGAGKGPG
jgi:hypothetical protein